MTTHLNRHVVYILTFLIAVLSIQSYAISTKGTFYEHSMKPLASGSGVLITPFLNPGRKELNHLLNHFSYDASEFTEKINLYRSKQFYNGFSLPIPQKKLSIKKQKLSKSASALLRAKLAFSAGEFSLAEEKLKGVSKKSPENSKSKLLQIFIDAKNRVECNNLKWSAHESILHQSEWFSALAAQQLINCKLKNVSENLLKSGAANEIDTKKYDQIETLIEIASKNKNLSAFADQLYFLMSFLKQDFDSALHFLQSAVSKRSSDIGMNYMLAEYLFQIEEFDSAKKLYQKVLSWSHDEEQRNESLKRIEEIENIVGDEPLN